MAEVHSTNQANRLQGSGPHGHANPLSLAMYAKGCRCGECLKANNEYKRRYIAKRLLGDPDYRKRIDRKHLGTAKYRESLKRRAVMPENRAKCVKRSSELIASRRQMLGEIKTRRGCLDCGYREHPAALDFDHVTGEKFIEVSVMGTFSLKRIMEEVAKCEVRCYRCHRIRTAEQMRNGDFPWKRKSVTEPSANTRRIARYRARGAAFLAEIKLQAGCSDCGYRAKSEALDFDHVRGEKEFNLSQRLQMPLRRLTAEAAKCDVVCANCHRIRTFERRSQA